PHSVEKRAALSRWNLPPHRAAGNVPDGGHLFDGNAVALVHIPASEFRAANDVLRARHGITIEALSILPVGAREEFRVVEVLQVLDGEDAHESDQLRMDVAA